MNCNKKDLLLYAVTDRSWLNGRTLYDQVEEALKGGATFIQLREKNLDTENSTQIIQLLSRLAHEENCCVVVVTHDLEVAKAADVVFRMDSGRIKEETV